MNKRDRIEKIFLYGVFAFYLLLLIKMLILSRISSVEMLDSQAVYRSVNFIPFYTIIEYLSGRTEILRSFSFGNLVGNIVVFIPLGLYVALFRKNKKTAVNILLVAAASLFAELIQWIFAIGAADIDDIILNSLGGCIGIFGYKLLLLLFRDEKRTQTAITVLSIAGFPVLYYFLFVIKMRF